MKPRRLRTPTQQFAMLLAAMTTLLGGYFWGNQYATDRLQRELGARLIPEAPDMPEFSLTDQNGRPFTREDLLQHWNLLYFGCLTCPEADSSVLPLYVQVYNRLADRPELRDGTRFLVVSTDPEELGSEVLRKRLAYFHADFLALGGSAETIATLRSAIGADPVAPRDDDTLPQSPSSPLLVVDPLGRRAAQFSGWVNAAAVAGDFRKIVDYLTP
jgi:protein SCO1